ncbi:hypothetical protein [Euzebya sp.]|uniref:hypothetical protein n=1 Tax=Euzebya sp. TaxID=1971409 RepID=UPI0035111D42
MPATLTVTDDALEVLKPLFSQVEGSCEVWTDAEVVTRMLIRGVMAYGQTAGKPFAEMTEVAKALRTQIETA